MFVGVFVSAFAVARAMADDNCIAVSDSHAYTSDYRRPGLSNGAKSHADADNYARFGIFVSNRISKHS